MPGIPLTGFDYGIYDIETFDLAPATANFNAEIIKQYCTPRVRFTFNEFVYDEYVLEAPVISRGTALSAGSCSIKLNNMDKQWTIFRTAKQNMGRGMAVGLYFPGIAGVLKLFLGFVEEVYYEDAAIVLECRDRMSPMLDKQMGSGQSEIDFYSTTYWPSVLTWTLLTTYGGLSGMGNSQNPHINWASYSQWQTDCSAKDFEIQARFAGQSLRSCLAEIARVTNSFFWLDGESKINFGLFEPPLYTGQDFTYDRSECIKIDASITKKTVLNNITIFYGYNPAADTWVDSVNTQDGVSAGRYGSREEVLESKIVWHADLASATSFAQVRLDTVKVPQEKMHIITPLLGLTCGIGDKVALQETLKDMISEIYWVNEIIAIDLNDGSIEIDGLMMSY